MVFNIFLNDLLYFVKDTQLLNFADDSTIAAFSNSVDDLITDLQNESENPIGWLRSNEMVVNPDKFPSIIINRLGKLKNSYELLTDNYKIELENSVTLLGIEIDNHLNFEKHVEAQCQKAGRQLMPCHAYISKLHFRK